MDDLISRQAAIDALEERLQANGYSDVKLVSELNRSIGYIMRLPSAQPEQRWIPVTEKLPENDTAVLVTRRFFYGGEERDHVDIAVHRDDWYCYTGPYLTFKVTAWMPLPKPYER